MSPLFFAWFHSFARHIATSWAQWQGYWFVSSKRLVKPMVLINMLWSCFGLLRSFMVILDFPKLVGAVFCSTYCLVSCVQNTVDHAQRSPGPPVIAYEARQVIHLVICSAVLLFGDVRQTTWPLRWMRQTMRRLSAATKKHLRGKPVLTQIHHKTVPGFLQTEPKYILSV